MIRELTQEAVPQLLEDLIESVQTEIDRGLLEYDSRDPANDAEVRRVAGLLLAIGADTEALGQLEEHLVERQGGAPLAAHLAVKLARSKAIVRRIEEPLHVSFVFAVYKERTRMLPPDEHPHGEDFIARKIEQFRWLFDDVESLTWDLFIVDDGCPDASGRLAEQILARRFPEAPAKVLFLEDAIAQDVPIIQPLASTSESLKGGSIVYGMWTATREEHDRHIVVFTDADLSTHLGQTGLLIDGIADRGMDAAIGSRREPTSVVIKKGVRNTRGKLFIYLWKGLVRPIHQVVDTQCGFKAFSAATLRDVLSDLIEKRFAFDIELLLKTELRRGGSICKVPIAWIDSEAASTTTDLEPYLPMLRAVVTMYRKYLPADPDSDSLAAFIESMSDAEWKYLSEHVPEEIAEADPADFGRYRPVSVDDLVTAMSETSGS